ncbi:MAG: hypothetical protein D6794_06140 [Deltaproteobacteria bacterium]|nr:MAG: hypothetical protein D6794_06140 [Deltaproteobacteria bacterium]
MITLWEATRRVAEIVGDLYGGTASSITGTSLTDNGLGAFSDGFFTDGVLWLEDGSGGYDVVGISNHSGTTLTYTTSITPGVNYYALNANYRADMLRSTVNQALHEIGWYDAVDTSLTSVAEQERYTLPSNVGRVLRVMVAGNTSAPYRWVMHTHWYQDFESGELVFDTDYCVSESGYTIRLRYEAEHPTLTAWSDTIMTHVDETSLVWHAAAYALRMRMAETKLDEPFSRDLWQRVLGKSALLRKRRGRRDAHMGGW